ncbi:TRAP transporter substrate-binding protein DctP [Thalassobacillus sp. C254]|uniref:TRAP transporter substrate-binding protein DctP n=1 Tax=Thalassobacillus sp. C254 TaxID=1225341 RepID=UPI0006D25597|nr:TRAP transporter substrate-binding protein DctP [Thalassobacillus sp. C254]
MKTGIVGIGSVLLFLGLVACGGEEAGTDAETGDFEEVTISLGIIDPPTEQSHFYQGVLALEEHLEEATDGAVTLDLYPNSELGGEREMIEAVQMGTLDMVATSTGPLGNFASKSYALDFPYLFRDREHVYAALDGKVGDEIGAQLEETGLYNLGWWENGWLNYTNTRNPIEEPEDLHNLDIR